MKLKITGPSSELIRAYMRVYTPAIRRVLDPDDAFVALALHPNALLRADPQSAGAVRVSGLLLPDRDGIAPEAMLYVGASSFALMSSTVVSMVRDSNVPSTAAEDVVHVTEMVGPMHLIDLAAAELRIALATAAGRGDRHLARRIIGDHHLVRAFMRARDLRLTHVEQCPTCSAMRSKVNAILEGH